MKSKAATQKDFETTKTAFVLFHLLVGRKSKVINLILEDQPNYLAIIKKALREQAKLYKKKRLSNIDLEIMQALTDLCGVALNQFIIEYKA